MFNSITTHISEFIVATEYYALIWMTEIFTGLLRGYNNSISLA